MKPIPFVAVIKSLFHSLFLMTDTQLGWPSDETDQLNSTLSAAHESEEGRKKEGKKEGRSEGAREMQVRLQQLKVAKPVESL